MIDTLLILLAFLLGPALIALEFTSITLLASALYYRFTDRSKLRQIKLLSHRNLVIAAVIPSALTLLFIILDINHTAPNSPYSLIAGIQLLLLWLIPIIASSGLFLRLLYRLYR